MYNVSRVFHTGWSKVIPKMQLKEVLKIIFKWHPLISKFFQKFKIETSFLTENSNISEKVRFGFRKLYTQSAKNFKINLKMQ